MRSGKKIKPRCGLLELGKKMKAHYWLLLSECTMLPPVASNINQKKLSYKQILAVFRKKIFYIVSRLNNNFIIQLRWLSSHKEKNNKRNLLFVDLLYLFKFMCASSCSTFICSKRSTETESLENKCNVSNIKRRTRRKFFT